MEAHVDQSLDSRERLGVVGYIDDVLPGSGAFGVWPGSHLRVNNLLRRGTDAAMRPPRNDLLGTRPGGYGPDMLPQLEQVLADTHVVDCWGHAGTVVLFHARIVHAPTHNYGVKIRQACITGFGKTVASLSDGERLAHVEHGDMWRDWSVAVRGAASAAAARL
jgi:hypothetical protein